MKLTPKIKIDPQEHLTRNLRVHALLSDFELEDVWQVPVKLTSQQPLRLFMEHFSASTDKITHSGAAGLLFRFRLWLGKVFNLDPKNNAVKNLISGSIRHRYATEEGLSFGDLPPLHGDDLEFAPVYAMENEQLSEIENKTVHAALHFSRVPIGDAIWGIHMAVYTKPKGLLGRTYMLLIKPFRLWVVYPALMKIVKDNWEGFVKTRCS